MAIGVPVLLPSNVPDKIWTVSLSLRCVVIFDCPGLRLSSSDWIKSRSTGSCAGQPSKITPMATPCDSPKVVMRNN
ncbi:hypothetical protein D3C86_1475790 [compost metagenome]